MSFLMLSRRGLLSLCLLCSGVQSALTLQSSRLSFRSHLDSRQASHARCTISGDLPCYQGLPADICCDSERTCLVIAANTTAVCVPAGFKTSDVNVIKPITCDISLQNWREHPDAPIKTIALQRKLPPCGQGSCCPHGYACKIDEMDEPRCVLDTTPDATNKYEDLRPSSIPMVTSYATASPTAINLNPDVKSGSASNLISSSSSSPASGSDVPSGILTLAVPTSTGEFRSTSTNDGVQPGSGDNAPSGDDGDGRRDPRDNLSIGLIVGVSIAAAVTAGLAVFVWLRRKQLFQPREKTTSWLGDDSPTPSNDERFGTPMAEMDSKDNIPEMEVRDYNTAELPADSIPCELPSPVHAAPRPRSLPPYIAELPGSPVSPLSPDSPIINKRASIVPLSSWNTRNAGQFERAKSLWYQKRGA